MSDEISIKFKPVGDSAVRVGAKLGATKVTWEWEPEDDTSCEALELLVDHSATIISKALTACEQVAEKHQEEEA